MESYIPQAPRHENSPIRTYTEYIDYIYIRLIYILIDAGCLFDSMRAGIPGILWYII